VNLKEYVRTIPDFPSPGILFYDIATLLEDAKAWRYTVDKMSDLVASDMPDHLVAIESRGFLIGASVAYKLGIGLTMVRKKNKLPGKTISFTYDLEYGSDTLEIQENAIQKGQKLILIDDLLATGGTIAAAAKLLQGIGADLLASTFIIELEFLNGRNNIDMPVHSLVTYSG
tara:strand:+ start:814 stop:1329 length:516 start_codon:yes stop_codon:yes gene_type:complete